MGLIFLWKWCRVLWIFLYLSLKKVSFHLIPGGQWGNPSSSSKAPSAHDPSLNLQCIRCGLWKDSSPIVEAITVERFNAMTIARQVQAIRGTARCSFPEVRTRNADTFLQLFEDAGDGLPNQYGPTADGAAYMLDIPMQTGCVIASLKAFLQQAEGLEMQLLGGNEPKNIREKISPELREAVRRAIFDAERLA